MPLLLRAVRHQAKRWIAGPLSLGNAGPGLWGDAGSDRPEISQDQTALTGRSVTVDLGNAERELGCFDRVGEPSQRYHVGMLGILGGVVRRYPAGDLDDDPGIYLLDRPVAGTLFATNNVSRARGLRSPYVNILTNALPNLKVCCRNSSQTAA